MGLPAGVGGAVAFFTTGIGNIEAVRETAVLLMLETSITLTEIEKMTEAELMWWAEGLVAVNERRKAASMKGVK